MKLIVITITLLLQKVVVAQETSIPEALVDIQNVRNNLKTKNEAVERFFQLLHGGSTNENFHPTFATSYQRLNIFGLQTPPVDPPKNPDGTPCSCNAEEFVPEILHVSKKPEKNNGPSFYVVSPRRPDDVNLARPTVHHYPKLVFDDFVDDLDRDIDPRSVFLN